MTCIELVLGNIFFFVDKDVYREPYKARVFVARLLFCALRQFLLFVSQGEGAGGEL